jgi:hypothetical protein
LTKTSSNATMRNISICNDWIWPGKEPSLSLDSSINCGQAKPFFSGQLSTYELWEVQLICSVLVLELG